MKINIEFLKEKKKEILIALAIIGVIIYSLVSNIVAFTNDKEEANLLNDKQTNLLEEKIIDKNIIYIHIDGAVKKKGLIELEEGDRLEKAIEKAEGLLDTADLRYVNLAMILSDGEKIYIPSKEELVDNTTGISYIPELQEIRKININRANVDELQKIPGVGISTAKKILEYRKKNGNFKKIEDIKKVSGIGDAKFEAMLEYISI